jgi:Predicted membrane protein (DUF2207)
VRTQQRRRINIALLAGGSLVAAAAAVGGSVVGDPERVTGYWSAAVVGDDGSAQVTEVIDYSFGTIAPDKHGLFRDVPGLPVDTPVAVSSPDAPAGMEITSEGDGIRIRIGDADKTVNGRRRYRIEYPLPDVRRGDTVDWESVGTGWEVGMDRAEVHLVTPFELASGRCFVGPERSTDQCELDVVEPGHVVAEVDSLGAREGVSIEGQAGAALAATPGAPAPPTERPDNPSTGLLPPAGTAAAAAALAAIPATLLVRRAGRERVAPGGATEAAYGGGGALGVGDEDRWGALPTEVPPPPPVPGTDVITPPPPPPPPSAAGPVAAEVNAGPAIAEPGGWVPPGAEAAVSEIRVDAAELAEMATTEFAPPPGISPSHGGIVLREEVRQEHKVAWLVQLAIEGVIDIDDDSIRYVGAATASPDEQRVVDLIFAREGEIRLGTYDSDFASGWSELSRGLEAWRESSGLWDRRGDQRRTAARVLGIVAVVVGLAGAVLGGVAATRVGAPGLVATLAGGVLAGAGLAAALGAWELHVRTPLGSALWLRIESFRRFLAGSEAYHAEEAAKRGVLREYTAWALALGEIDRWSNAVAAAAIPPDVAGVSYAYIGPMLMLSTISTAAAPSSSGGGGGSFGGGGVGGGAGGGGGGSW